MSRLRLAVIGVGHLGKEHARILSTMPGVSLVGVVDVNGDQAAEVAQRCHTRPFEDYRALLHEVDAAVIVTPTVTHHEVAGEFLNNGVSVLVEKPLTAAVEQAEELVDLAHRRGALLQVGHIERFNPAFEELQHRPLQPKFIMAQRLGFYTGRSTDIGAVFDLMIHDLDILLALVGSPVDKVEALGMSVLGGPEDMAHARLTFANGCIADLTASRISLEPSRRMQIWGPEGYARIDFARRVLTLLQPSEELLRRRKQIGLHDSSWTASLKQDLMRHHLQALDLDCNRGDQLTRELEDFVRCLRTGAQPRVPGEAGCKAVALASRVVESLRRHPWEPGHEPGLGPIDVPAPTGKLFAPDVDEAAA
ncbi:MAG: Gfo/Idh/MocA family oxidoreductase [Gemmataceae bacterium]